MVSVMAAVVVESRATFSERSKNDCVIRLDVASFEAISSFNSADSFSPVGSVSQLFCLQVKISETSVILSIEGTTAGMVASLTVNSESGKASCSISSSALSAAARLGAAACFSSDCDSAKTVACGMSSEESVS